MTQGGEGGEDGLKGVGLLDGRLAFHGGDGLFAGVVGRGSDLALGLEGGEDALVFPAKLGGDALEGAEAAAGLETEGAEGLGDDEAFEGVVGGRDAVKGLEAVEGGHTAGRLVGDHATNDTPELTGRCTEMERTLFGVDKTALAQKVLVLYYKWTC